VIPGFGPSLGFTLFFLAAVVIVPLAFVVLTARGLTFAQMAAVAFSQRAIHAYAITFGASAAAAAISSVVGLAVAVVLVRYRFPGRAVLDAFVDIPFALPTAVAGIALTTLYDDNGWLGRIAAAHGIHIAFTPIGIGIALIFVGIPFAVRTVEPALADLPQEYEEIAETLGTKPFQTFVRVILPLLAPSMLVGFALAFARAIGEYGSVVFIAGNIPFKTEVAPLLIVTHLEEFDYAGAAVLAIVMLIVSGTLILAINLFQRKLRWART
jgi:sulfate transport system permease protein